MIVQPKVSARKRSIQQRPFSGVAKYSGNKRTNLDYKKNVALYTVFFMKRHIIFLLVELNSIFLPLKITLVFCVEKYNDFTDILELFRWDSILLNFSSRILYILKNNSTSSKTNVYNVKLAQLIIFAQKYYTKNAFILIVLLCWLSNFFLIVLF